MESIEQLMKRRLDERVSNGTLRSLCINKFDIDFYSNDYLSLSSIETKELKYDTPGSSRLIAGNTHKHEELEKRFSTFLAAETALLFNSGYSANTGILSAVPQKDDIILFDERSHSSIKDGIRLSLAKAFKFKHNDVTDLEKKLKKFPDKRCFVVTEGLFSMDGTYGRIKEINRCCEQFGAYLIVDEAHSGGTFGEKGKGICHFHNIKPFATIFTMGKAFGSHGALITCSQITKDYLVNFARTFIYTTALPQSVLQRSLLLLDEGLIASRVKSLQQVVEKFNLKFSTFSFKSDSASPVKIFVDHDVRKLKRLESACHSAGIGIKAIFPPTVPASESCLRISLHANQTDGELDRLFTIFSRELS